MWLIKLHCSLFLLLPVILSAPLSQRVVSATTRRWSYHANDRSVQITWHEPSPTPEERRKDCEESHEISSALEALMRTAKPGPGDRWPHALSSLTSDMVEGLDESLHDGDAISAKLSSGRQSVSTRLLPNSGRDSRWPKDVSTDANVSDRGNKQGTRVRKIKYRYLTMFQRAKAQSTIAGKPCDQSLSELESPFNHSGSYVDLNEQKDFLSVLLWITGRPIWSWAAIFTLAIVLFIASVIIVETTAALVNLVKWTVGVFRSRKIRLEGAEKKITAISPEEDGSGKEGPDMTQA